MEELRFKYSREDIVKAARTHFLRSFKGRFLMGYLCVLMIAGIVVTSLGILPIGPFIMTFASLVFPMYYFAVIPFLTNMQFKKLPHLSDEIIMRFDENEFHKRSFAGEVKIEWLLKVINTPDVLLFYSHNGVIYMIPRRVCEDGEQFARLISLGNKLTTAKISEV